MLTRAGLACFLAAAVTIGCAPTVTTGAFTQTARIDAELKRGISTKRDVRRVLGVPKGSGGAVLPTDPRLREVWYYEDVKIAKLRQDTEGYLRADVSQQILLVFFRAGLFDGFMWYAGGGPVEPR